MRRLQLVATVLVGALLMAEAQSADQFQGEYFHGEGDVDYLRLLDVARRMFDPDPEFQNVAMLYTPAWNGFVEGPTWGAWWIQNSYGPTYCALPFYIEPYVTFLQNAQDLWFAQMGDGKRAGAHDWVAPDGALCDAAAPEWIVYKQGDGRIDIHDWGMEFTAAGLLMQVELLLIARDDDVIDHYLPKLERCAEFIWTRHDPKNDCFLAGPAGNLLAPSYAGWKKPDGTYDKAYLTGLSVTYIAALDRLIELEKLAGHEDRATRHAERRERTRRGLEHLTTDEGYLIRSLDPDGTRHGIYGAEKHGYFEASPNHDAIAHRVVDDAQAERIYAKIASIPELRRHVFILPNYPGYDDMYVEPNSWLWSYGTWVNGGHWSTCEGRMVMAYYRLGKYDDARRSMQQLLTFARDFRMDNPLVEFGSKVYQPKQPINLCYDSFGPPAALVRGLFEYLYKADRLVLMPHIPPTITALEQRFPIRFGRKRLYLSASGAGPVTSVTVNGVPHESFDARSVSLRYDGLPDIARIAIAMGGAEPPPPAVPETAKTVPPPGAPFWTNALEAPKTNAQPLRIGADSAGGSRFVGDVRRARIHGRALSAEQVAALKADASATVDDTSVIADWIFEGTGEGVVEGGEGRYPLKAAGEVGFADGALGRALRLTGEGWLETPHHANLAPSDGFSLDAWIRPKQQSDRGGRIIDKVTAGRDDGYLLDTFPGNSLRFITPWGAVSHDAKLAPDAWCHVAATFDKAAGLRLYVNGQEVATAPAKEAKPLARFEALGRLYERLAEAGLGECYEAKHAQLVVDAVATIHERKRLQAEGRLDALPAPSQDAADGSYVETANRLAEGLQKVLDSYEGSDDPHERRIAAAWRQCRLP